MMKINGACKKTAVMAAAACCMVLAAQTPAVAHDQSVPIRAASSYYYGRIQILQSHHRIMACDERADGVGVWVEFYTSDGLRRTLDDANGSTDPCGSYTNNSLTITQFRGWARNGVNTGWQTA
jgi:hypothetical protein